MIDHPALLVCNQKRPSGGYIATATEEKLCLDQLKVLVRWLKKHNYPLPEEMTVTPGGCLLLLPSHWQSLLKAAGLEKP